MVSFCGTVTQKDHKETLNSHREAQHGHKKTPNRQRESKTTTKMHKMTSVGLLIQKNVLSLLLLCLQLMLLHLSIRGLFIIAHICSRKLQSFFVACWSLFSKIKIYFSCLAVCSSLSSSVSVRFTLLRRFYRCFQRVAQADGEAYHQTRPTLWNLTWMEHKKNLNKIWL